MRQFVPEGPKKTIQEICANYGLFFNPEKKFTHLTITVGEEKIQVHPKDLNPFINAKLYCDNRYEEINKIEYEYNTTLKEPTKLATKLKSYSDDKARQCRYTESKSSVYILSNEDIPA